MSKIQVNNKVLKKIIKLMNQNSIYRNQNKMITIKKNLTTFNQHLINSKPLNKQSN